MKTQMGFVDLFEVWNEEGQHLGTIGVYRSLAAPEVIPADKEAQRIADLMAGGNGQIDFNCTGEVWA